MTRLLITEAGEEKTITDIAAYREELHQISTKLVSIYADFKDGSQSSLYSREAEIVTLINRYNELKYVIGRFEQAEVRDANIDAGWHIVNECQCEEES